MKSFRKNKIVKKCFECEDCDLTFALKKDLLDHICIETGVKPGIECDMC